jgi:type II secretory pathway pseudopilin PulG
MGGQRGFTYLGVLLVVAMLGVGLTAVSEVWVTVARRQRMEQLQWVGQQYVHAIGSYYESSPGHVKAYPKTLQDLLEDRRFVVVRRHLRQAYVDPFSGVADWEFLVAPDGGIRGVRVRLPFEANGSKQQGTEFVYLAAVR